MKKRSLLIIIGALLLMTAAISLALMMRAGSFKGSGSSEDPYIIKSGRDLRALSERISSGDSLGGVYFALDGDIEVSSEAEIFPMGKRSGEESVPFEGVLDGRGHAIKGISVKTKGNAGLFDILSGSIYNLTMDYGSIEGEASAGAFAAVVTETGSIINCCNYANVLGETAGGISGYTEGKLVNCVIVLDVENEPGVQQLTGSDDRVHSSNCYVYDGDNFELFVHGSADNQEKTYRRAVDNLNARIAELSLQQPEIGFCKWSYREEFPNVALLTDRADTVTSVELNGQAAVYDQEGHFWELPEKEALGDISAEDSLTLSYTDSLGKTAAIECSAELEEIHFVNDGMESILRLYDEEAKIKEAAAGSLEGLLELSDILEGEKGLYTVDRGYYNKEGTEERRERIVYIISGSSFTLKGDLEGAVVFDCGKESEICLEGVSINSVYGPALLVKNKKDGKGMTVFKLADDTDNSLYGSNTMDIYSESYDKEEGVISCHTNAALQGDKGSLYIKGDLEGIEVKGDLTMEGGHVNVDGVTDDGLSIDECFELSGGWLRVLAYDNVLDCEKVKLSGGRFIVLGPTKNENCLKDDVELKGVEMAAGFTRNKPMSEKSEQPLIAVRFQEMMPAGSIVLLTDEEDNPLMGYKMTDKALIAGFSAPYLGKENYHMYLCESLEGDWDEELCSNISDYVPAEQLTIEGDPCLSAEEIDNRFEVDQ